MRTPLGAGDFSQYLTPVLNSDADVLVLNHYGQDMVNSLTQAVQFGMKNKQVNGKQFEIVVPLYSELMAQGAGEAVKGILGSANWDWKLDNAGTKAFTKSFGKKYGCPPSQAAQTCYAQTMLYADAVARAGSFAPCEVGKALEGYEFDGLGNGQTLYRAADHQCFKPVLVVRGAENPTNQYDLLEIVEGRADRAGDVRAGQPDVRRRQPRQLQQRQLTAATAPNGAVQIAGACGRRRFPAADRTPRMDAILLQFLNGLDKGSAYALIALGLTLIFGTLGVVNFAHGALFMMGAFCAVTMNRLLATEHVTIDPDHMTPWGTPVEVKTPYIAYWLGDAGTTIVDWSVVALMLIVHAVHAAGRRRDGARADPALLQAAACRADPRHLRPGHRAAGTHQGGLRRQPDPAADPARTVRRGAISACCWALTRAPSSIPGGASSISVSRCW